MKVAIPVTECTVDGSAVPGGKTATAPVGSKFRYVASTTTEAVVIQFLRWNDSKSAEARLFNEPEASGTGVKSFCMNAAHFQGLTERVYAKWYGSRQWAAGALLLPVKMRGRNGLPFDFSKDVTLGTAAGYKFRISETRDEYVNLLFGVGLSAVTLDSANTSGAVRQGTDRAALTWTLGLMFEIDGFQFGTFLGQDRLSQPNQNDWLYQGRTWLALGLGYSLFGSAKTENPAGGNN